MVVELKNRKFIPEYAGKLNFYLSAVDSLLKRDDDQPTIGLLLLSVITVMAPPLGINMAPLHDRNYDASW